MPKLSVKKKKTCEHNDLLLMSSSHAAEAGYKRPTCRSILRSDDGSGPPHESTFPAPLILPGDDLALDPKQPPQSLRAWSSGKHRNAITPSRRTVYLAAPPVINSTAAFMMKWKMPRGEKKIIEHPDIKDVLSYLEAFYHGLPVELLPPSALRFTTWEDDGRESCIVGLEVNDSSLIGIRGRRTPEKDFPYQLKLDDILDAAIDVLPEDAYALMVLVEQDLFEDESDEFVCGRAYGGSRVAVVSTARYNPVLDQREGLEREHAWPASHCNAYLETLEPVDKLFSRKRKRDADDCATITPMTAAVTAHNALPNMETNVPLSILAGLWLGRVARTASHELGHCFGIAHCVYYACSMQGSASLIEDSRQPPFLCPVDLAKVLQATGSCERDRYDALLSFCEKHSNTHVFAAFGAWIRGRLTK